MRADSLRRSAVLLSLSCVEALRVPAAARASVPRRQALVGGAALLLTGGAPAFAEKKKEYLTLDQYQKLQAQEKKDEELFGKFETLRSRAAQTSEFDSLADKGDFGQIQDLARAWDANIRKDILEQASKALAGDAKDKGEGLNKAVLADLKKLDKSAKAKDADGVKTTSADLRGHVMAFTDLEPEKLINKFGGGGGSGSGGAVEDL